MPIMGIREVSRVRSLRPRREKYYHHEKSACPYLILTFRIRLPLVMLETVILKKKKKRNTKTKKQNKTKPPPFYFGCWHGGIQWCVCPLHVRASTENSSYQARLEESCKDVQSLLFVFYVWQYIVVFALICSLKVFRFHCNYAPV